MHTGVYTDVHTTIHTTIHEAPHDPVSCDLYSDWLDMVELGTGVDPRTGTSDQQALNRLSEKWVQQNTRQCPACNLAILKADGCNHMTCRNPKCNHQWCWICRKEWSKCGGTYNCAQKDGADFFGATNNEEANKKIAAALLDSKNTIEYFGSYLALESSLKMEQELLNGGVLRRRVDALQRQYLVRFFVFFIFFLPCL
jgi:hypothetical protein